MAAQRGSAKARRNRKLIVFGVELVIIAIMVVALIFVIRSGEESEGPIIASVEDLAPEEIGISQEVQELIEEGGSMSGYLNIAFFGIDALSTGTNDLLKGYRSDCIMICSINQDTGDVKLCSVYRDTYLNLGNDKYSKCNAAYAKGGAQQAISMLNSNLDMDITNWVSVSYKALSEAIDDLGGVYIDVDGEEIKHINSYQSCIADILKTDYVPVKDTGYQLLNGIQAAAYCRIRYTAGDDFKRTERQREVLKSMVDQAKKASPAALTKVFNHVMDDVYTSLDSDTITELLSNITKYNIVAENGFPEESMRATGTIGAAGSCVIPRDLQSNVIWLHKFLFDDEAYVPTSTVQGNSAKIASDTGKYLGQ